MKTLNIALAAAAISIGLVASASAMPTAPLAQTQAAIGQVDQVRLVCNRFGRCWRTGPVFYGRGYGYGWHRGWRGGRRWR